MYKFAIPLRDIAKMCLDARLKLSKEFDVVSPESENYGYQGLCDSSCEIVVDCLEDYVKNNSGLIIKFKYIHGEQRHKFGVNPQIWFYEHTWLELDDGENIIYVDPTMSQFSEVYKEHLGESQFKLVYLNNEPPSTYLRDRDNLAFKKGIVRKLYKIWFNYIIYPIGCLIYKMRPIKNLLD